MDNVLIRIKEYAKAKKLSGASLARTIGMKPVSVNQYLSGKRAVSWEFIRSLLASDDGLSAEWLTRGKGDMFKDNTYSNEDTAKLLKELADLKIEMLVQKGIADKLCKIVEAKIEK